LQLPWSKNTGTVLGGQDNYVFHSLRKGFATQVENAGVPHNVAARL